MTKITVFLIFLIVLVVGYYSYLSGKSRTEQQEAIMSEVDTALSRDLTNNYPATPKEVIRYYNDLIKCFYNEDCTTEELQEAPVRSPAEKPPLWQVPWARSGAAVPCALHFPWSEAFPEDR
jgi:hypothetical protein